MPRLSIDRLRELAAAGMSNIEMAAALGIGKMTVIRWRMKYGIPAGRPVGMQRADRLAEHHLSVLSIDLPGEIAAKPAASKAWRLALAGRAYADAVTAPTVAQRGDGPATRLYAEARS